MTALDTLTRTAPARPAHRVATASVTRAADRPTDIPSDRSTDVRLGWKVRHLVLAGAAIAVVGWLAYRSRESIDLALWRDQIHLGWAVLAFAGAALTLAGNAWNLMGASPVRLRFGPTLAAQAAGTLARLVSPAAVGGAAVNVQYLRCAGVGNVASIGAVSVAQTVQVVMAVILLPPVAVIAGTDLLDLTGDGWRLALYVGLALGVLAGVAAVLVRRSPLVEARLRVLLGELTRSLRAMAAEPRRAAVSMGGAVLISVALIGALWASIQAFGGSLGIATVACVLLLGSTAGNAVPVPGGLGSVDAALVAALGAAGVQIGVALPAVALFRLVTLWLQIPVGLVCVGGLRRRGAL